MESNGLKYVLKYGAIVILSSLLVLSFSLWFVNRENSKKQTLTQTFSENNVRTFVIDAGHGGEDAGAVASDGTLEKDLNLNISRSLCLLYELNGENAVMTRYEDTLLYDHYGDLDNYKGKKKIYDLKNRVRITKEQENPVYIGIHMNKFPQSKYRGLQVYYSKNNEKSRILAENVQKNTHTYIQFDNKRQIKQADSSIYILDALDCPSILVECGFMSNAEELNLYKSEEYRRDIATVIFASTLNIQY